MVVVHKTPFLAGLFPILDKDGTEARVAVLKASYEIKGETLRPAEVQEPICLEDKFRGKPGTSSTLCESDAAYFKPAADIIVIGTAYAPKGQAVTSFQASLSVGEFTRTVMVMGDRVWSAGRVFGASMSDPKPCAEVPLCWEKAFGGADTSLPDPAKHDWERRNPIGTGFRADKSGALDGMPLPNFEDPKNPIKRWNDRPTPQGFGFVGRHWEPRLKHAGTYDDAWQKNRVPLPPVDFDYKFFNGAPPEMIYPGLLRGDEVMRLVNLSKFGEERFRLPGQHVRFRGFAQHRRFEADAVLDTLMLMPDKRKVVLIWRSKYTVSMNEQADAASADMF